MLLIIVCFVLLCNDDDENDSFLFVCMCLRVCGEKGEQSRRQRNGVLFVLVSLLLVSRVFVLFLIIVVRVCVVVFCECILCNCSSFGER